MVTGTVVCAVGLGAASLATGVPGPSAPEAAGVDVPAGSEFNGARDDVPATLSSEPDAPPQAGETPEVGAPAPDDLSSIAESDMESAAVPETGMADANLTAPQVIAEDSGMSAASEPEAPAVGTSSAVPDAPVEDAGEQSISVDPEQPAPPSAEAESAAFPEQDGEATAPDVASAVPDLDLAEEPEAVTEPPEPEAMTEPPEPDAMGGAAEAEAETAQEEPPAKTIGNLAENVATNRLPSVTDTPEELIEAEPEQSESARAIEANAEPFDNPEDKPLMAIILIDDGTSPIGLDALASFPYPLSFAVDASWDGAAEAARKYRDAGFEVLALADLPPGARASDTEIAMQTVLDAVPGAVAVIEGTGAGLQSDRAAAEQLAPILLESGHGLVLFPNGLDTARKLISREGVPTGAVFRDFDAKGQDAAVIRRFLDQAAFKAGRRQGKVIMLGRLRADTISALLLWGLQDRASSVAIAPISAVLTEEPQ
ncbi:divergent polysaccharide deacetylase family protein [Roseovarius spongiae]|uniref:Divergent polysaccharide deacetylase family protein n=1 Tax=Roseovarius spongiae TaxID=2320272 RepID=A0A3A8B5V7_9RHOB|nr:divergent polysaccharide deacetylase family protein [Roseovarius spongiae]